MAENPEAFYTLVSSRKDGCLAAVCYAETVLTAEAADFTGLRFRGAECLR